MHRIAIDRAATAPTPSRRRRAGFLSSALCLATLVLLAVATVPSAPALARQAQIGPDFADLAERLLPSVVNVSTTQTLDDNRQLGHDFPQFPPGSPFEEFFRDFFDRRGDGQNTPPRRATSLGSGFIVDAEDGYIVTNNHVIKDADEITVTLHDDTTVTAEVVGRDEKTDVAVLQVKTDVPLTAVSFGDSDRIRVGDWVMAIGNPFGLGGTVTAGIVSARARDIQAGPYDDFLQTDASINRGNSGGPMFDLDGEVIGINTAIFSPSGGSVGIGFAIPSNLAKPVIDQLIKFGRTRRGWLGVRIQTVTPEIAESLGLADARGALVASVTPGGPAEDSGIEAGDVILSFNGQEVPEMRRLPRIVAETDVGEMVPVTVWRDGRSRTIDVTLGELEKAEESGLLDGSRPTQEPHGAPSQEFDQLGLRLSAITPELRREYNLRESARGVVVTGVIQGSPAAEKLIRPGDVIVEVSQEEVTSPAEIAAKIEEARTVNKTSILMLVDRDGDLRFVGLSLK